MAWIRYDDTFYSNPKVTAVVHEDPGALALHILANTWSNGQKHPGFVPSHQPAMLLCDKQLGVRWAEVLVRAGLWHRLFEDECAECLAEYDDLPPTATGWVFHNARQYRAPARDRAMPGTPVDLSEKRREAGRKGGRISAARRKEDETKQEQANQASASTGQAKSKPRVSRRRSGRHDEAEQSLFGEVETPGPAETEVSCQANGVSKDSNLLLAGVSPEPEPGSTSASNEAEAVAEATPQQRAFGVARAWISYRDKQGTPVIATGKGDDPALHKLRNLIEPFTKAYTDNEIKQALKDIGVGIPTTSRLDGALADVRTNGRNQQGRLNGGMRSGPLPESNAPKRYSREERCTTHTSYPAANCGPCRADRLAESRA